VNWAPDVAMRMKTPLQLFLLFPLFGMARALFLWADWYRANVLKQLLKQDVMT
jgi:hypothetical protein